MGSDAPWQGTVAAALIGTERQPFSPPTTSGNLAQVLGQLSARSPEATLLTTAAILALHQRAGWLPATQSPPGEPCSLEDLPCCPPQATRMLQQMLQGQYPEFLPEWLALVSDYHQRIPDLYLPELLDRGRQQSGLRGAILPGLGQRGHWLAAQNPNWGYALAVTTAADWETGSPGARLLYLQSWRSLQPDQARDLLQATWKQEAASDRAKFLDTLQIGLSLADEPMLEAALEDRSKEVRRVAAALLTRLPQSRLGQRMAARVASLVTITRQEEGYSLEVNLPETCDQGMQRDGISLKTPDPTGSRAAWLQQMIAATPLSFWEQAAGSILDLLEAAQGHEWQDLLLNGWQQAALQQQNGTWARALLHTGLERGWDCALGPLLGVLTPDQQAAYGVQALQTRRQRGMGYVQVLELLGAIAPRPQVWTQELASLSLAFLGELLPDLRSSWYGDCQALLEALPFCTPPELLPAATDLQAAAARSPLATAGYPLVQDVQNFLSALQFRQDLQRAFQT